MSTGLIILVLLVLCWWLYSTKKVVTERHDWLQEQLDTRNSEKAALLDIIAQRAFIFKFQDMRDNVGIAAIQRRTDDRLGTDSVFRTMFAVAQAAEDTEANSEWRKKWLE